MIPAHAPKPKTRWRHFKGGTYVIDGAAYYTESDTVLVLYHMEGAANQVIWARPLRMWFEEVKPGITRFTEIPDA